MEITYHFVEKVNDTYQVEVNLRFVKLIPRRMRDYSGENRGENQALVGAIPFCGEYPGPRFEDKFRSANQMDGISITDGGKMADS